jgi:cysteine-rich repeat protein
VCGNGLRGYEECDDSNINANDGCSPQCRIEPGWQYKGGSLTSRDFCNPICGDGERVAPQPIEDCEDQNKMAGDGCDEFCATELGWVCAGGTMTSPDVCRPICGDGLRIEGKEACDDGNLKNGDGCNDTCKVERGWKCAGGSLYETDNCQPICGDSCLLEVEGCDDGNENSNDGCDSSCQIEPFYRCFLGGMCQKQLCTCEPLYPTATFSDDWETIYITYDKSLEVRYVKSLDSNIPSAKLCDILLDPSNVSSLGRNYSCSFGGDLKRTLVIALGEDAIVMHFDILMIQTDKLWGIGCISHSVSLHRVNNVSVGPELIPTIIWPSVPIYGICDPINITMMKRFNFGKRAIRRIDWKIVSITAAYEQPDIDEYEMLLLRGLRGKTDLQLQPRS